MNSPRHAQSIYLLDFGDKRHQHFAQSLASHAIEFHPSQATRRQYLPISLGLLPDDSRG
jgi:hypothetical protein